MAQKTYRKGDDVMVADESLEQFLTLRGWSVGESEVPAEEPVQQTETPALKPRKRAAKKTAAPKQSAPAADPNRPTPIAANRQEQ